MTRKSRSNNLFGLISAASVLLLTNVLIARADDPFIGPSATPYSIDASTQPARPDKPSRFVQQLSKKMDWPEDKLHKLESHGFARTEMILLVMMEKKTDEKWEDLVKERDKGKTLREMAEKRMMPYNDLFRKATITKADIDNAVLALPPEIQESTGAVKEQTRIEKSTESVKN